MAANDRCRWRVKTIQPLLLKLNPLCSGISLGVYLTSLPPLDGKPAVAINNWEQAFIHALEKRKLDYVIMILMPVDDVVRAETKRDVYLYEGDLVLEEYDDHEILTWKKAVKKCEDLTLQMLDLEDEEPYDDEYVDDWIPNMFPY